jgi:hypothetical protein
VAIISVHFPLSLRWNNGRKQPTSKMLNSAAKCADRARIQIEESIQANRLWPPPRGLPPGVIWDKSCAQQARCLLNKPSARHVLMGLHCLINLKLFFVAQLSLSATSFFTVFRTYINPFHLLFGKCMIQTDGQAGKPDQSTLTMCVVHLESGFLVRVIQKY